MLLDDESAGQQASLFALAELLTSANQVRNVHELGFFHFLISFSLIPMINV